MKDRRSRLIVNQFQSKMLLRILAYWFIYQCTLWNFLFCLNLLEDGTGSFLEQHLRFFRGHYPILICLVFLVPFFAWDAIRFTHRVSGPIHRVRQTIRAITAGKTVSRIRPRKGDQLQDMVGEFNGMLEFLQQQGVLKLSDSRPSIDDSQPADASDRLCQCPEQNSDEELYDTQVS